MTLIGTPITFGKLEQDLLIWMADNSREYCCTGIKITNATGDPVKHTVGDIVTSATLSDSSDPKTQQGDFTDALLLKNITVPANDSVDVRALVRGPALVNFDAVTKTSPSESDASVRSRISNLVAKGIAFVRQPLVSTTPDLNS